MAETDKDWDAAQEGAELIAEGEHEAARIELERLALADEHNPYAYFFLGSAHFEMGNYAKALKAYVTSLELAPDYLGAMIGLGHTLRLLGRYAEAIRMGHQVLSRAGEDPDALYLMGASHFARGDNAAAKGLLERFIQANPEVEAAMEAQGMLQLIAGDIEEAEEYPDPGPPPDQTSH